MPVTAVVGACWGDEGKGKLTDAVAADAQWVVRFQGGRNAGHTIESRWGRFALHLLPSGVFRATTANVLRPAVALDPPALFEELAGLERAGVPAPRLYVSDRAQVVLPHHAELDDLEEERLGADQLGTTRVGIAPFYAEKARRIGIQVCDLSDPKRLESRLDAGLAQRNALLCGLYGAPPLSIGALVDELTEWGRRLQPYVADTTTLLHEALARGERIIVEGQLGALRDPDHGIHPFTTSSSPLAGYAATGACIPPTAFDTIIAVVKAYSSSVGGGPFVTELSGATAEALRVAGREFGATTDRPRRVGHFDAVAAHYGCRVQGATEVCLTLLDVLSERESLQICTAYEIDGMLETVFPTMPRLERASPVYESWPGFSGDLGAVWSAEDLPEEARRYVDRIEELIACPIRWISVGPGRDALIRRR
ncbi:MAG: adenylosuccinate synthase [bacterium]|nr:adenylosuccinate synthase [bacterium]